MISRHYNVIEKLLLLLLLSAVFGLHGVLLNLKDYFVLYDKRSLLVSVTDETPGLYELITFQGKRGPINIAEQIGSEWELVGLTLLQDRTGQIVSAIEEQHRGNVMKINVEILRRWVQGQGTEDRTWRGLLGVLKLHCKALAESVEEALTLEKATDVEKGKLSPTK